GRRTAIDGRLSDGRPGRSTTVSSQNRRVACARAGSVMTDFPLLMRSSIEETGSSPDDSVVSAQQYKSYDREHRTERNETLIRPRVVILTNIPAPYRVHQFTQLASSNRYDYLVYFCSPSEPNRQWRQPESYGFRHEILNARPHTFLGGYSYFVPGFLL